MNELRMPRIDPEGASRLLRALGDLVLEVSPDGTCVGADGDTLLLDGSLEGLVGQPIGVVVQEGATRPLSGLVDEVRALGTAHNLEFDLALRDRQPQRLEARIAPGAGGNVFVILRDIGDRGVAERKLRESEERFRVMADHAPVMLWKSGTDGECDFFNQRWLEFTGRTMEEEQGIGWAAGLHVEDFQRCMDIYMDAFVTRREFRMEYRLRRADGAFRWILDQGTPRFGPDGAFEGFVGSCIDITEMRESQEKAHRLADALVRRLHEREALLREVHHRVKNNLQLVTSLQNLQARTLPMEARALLQQSQFRVRSMALVHEHLCTSNDMVEVDFLRYTRDLVSTLVHALGDGLAVDTTVDGDGVVLGVDQAIPCGLILTELVTNALKHAFVGRRRGRIGVFLRRGARGWIRVTVEDDGVGLPTNWSLEQADSLGCDLIVTLAKQLRAQLDHHVERGTRFEVAFPASGRTEQC